jgi:ribosomal protein L18E
VRRPNATTKQESATIAAYSSHAKAKISKSGKQTLTVEALKTKKTPAKSWKIQTRKRRLQIHTQIVKCE